MSKFLVTGGLGLIGHNVVQRLQQRGEEVAIVDNRTTYGIIPQAELDYLDRKSTRLNSSHSSVSRMPSSA
mgnify:CR=1 FL=1